MSPAIKELLRVGMVGLIVILAGAPDSQAKLPAAFASGRQLIILIFCIVLLFLSACGTSPCGEACDWDQPLPRNGECFCQRPDGAVYGPVPMKGE